MTSGKALALELLAQHLDLHVEVVDVVLEKLGALPLEHGFDLGEDVTEAALEGPRDRDRRWVWT